MKSSEEALISEIRNWTEKTGIPLELYTKSVFAQQGFAVTHSTLFEDSQLDKAREIDVVAYHRDSLGIVQIYLIIECKSSSKPWVVLTDRESFPRPLNYSFGLTSDNVKEALPISFELYRSPMGKTLELLHRGGYALRVAHSNKEDPAFGAAISVLKAAQAHVTNEKGKMARYKFAIPVIVVDAPIVECNLTETGQLEYQSVDYSEAKFTAFIPTHRRASIRIVTKDALPKFATRAKLLAEAIVKQMDNHITAFVNAKTINASTSD